MDKKQILENITAEENKCNLIFEAGGIGFSNYLSEINTIAAYVSAYIATFPPSKDNKWKSELPPPEGGGFLLRRQGLPCA